MEPPRFHRAALFREFGAPMSIESVESPRPGYYGVLVRVTSAGICHSDLHIWAGDFRHVGIPRQLPWIVGHEIVGVVAAKGEGVPDSVRIGSKVLVYAWQYAEEDDRTLKGHTQLARRRARLSIDVPGGLQEYVLVPHYRFVLEVGGLEDAEAAAPLACAGLTTYRAVKKLRSRVGPGDYVLVVGLGGLGSYAVQWVRALMPYARLVVADLREEAIEFASKLAKPEAVVNPSREDPLKALGEITRGEGVKAVIDLVGSERTISTYIRSVAVLGSYAMVGLMGQEARIPVHHVVRGEIEIFGTYTGSMEDQVEVLELARRGLVNYRGVVSARYRFEEVNEAFKAVAENKHVGRVLAML